MFFSEAEQKRITDAIKQAELQTSGEIKVHVEEHCPYDDPLHRATEVFRFLSLEHTALRNGVLFYISITDRKFAILGDQGIDRATGPDFWNASKDLMYLYLHSGDTITGLCLAIEKAGEALKLHFPYDSETDKNEIPDNISFGRKK